MLRYSSPGIGFLDDRYVNVTGDTMTGALIITPTADGTEIFRVNQADGTNIFTVDTSTPRILMTRQLYIDGEADEIQFKLERNVTQTANMVENLDSDGISVLSGADERGILFSDGGIDSDSVYIGKDAGNIFHTNAVRNFGLGGGFEIVNNRR